MLLYFSALPHGLLKESTSVCLLVKDLEGKKAPLNYEPTKDHFEDLLREKDVKFVSEVGFHPYATC